jgi:hypothetical protein
MSEYKSQVLKDMVKDALEYLSEEKIAEVFDFVGYLLAKEKQEKRGEETDLYPKKDPILKYTEGVSVEPFAHRIDEMLYGE